MKNLDFEWLTDEFMLYCRSTQLREKTMSSYRTLEIQYADYDYTTWETANC